MAISFPVTGQKNTISSSNYVSKHVNCEDNKGDDDDIFNDHRDNLENNDDSGSDVEIEDEDEEINEKEIDTKPPEPFNDFVTMKMPEKSIGRGRGMVKFPATPARVGGEERSKNVPIAKVSPSGFANNKQFHSPQYENLNNSKHQQSNRNNSKGREFKSKKHFRPIEKRDFQQQRYSPSQQQGRFQTVLHPKESLAPKQETRSFVSDFGMEKPNMCFHCRASDHFTEECAVSNPFF